MDYIENNPKMAMYICAGIVGIIVIIGGIVWSTDTVEPIEYGIKYNKMSRSIDKSTTYEGGWYIIGPMN